MPNTSSLIAYGIQNIAEIQEAPKVKTRQYRNNKTNPAGARAIRLLAKKGVTQAEIAKIFNLHQCSVSKIVRQQSFAESE